MTGRVHIIGAGLSGLAAAIALNSNRRVELYEAASQAGGRCRSYDDSVLGCRIDNGNHFIMAANEAAGTYLETIGAAGTMSHPAEPGLGFVDLATDERWHLRPNTGLLPWWLLDAGRRVPGTAAGDYLAALRLVGGGGKPIAARLDTGSVLYRRFWEPMIVAVLNTPPEEADPAPLRRVFAEVLSRGGRAFSFYLPREGLSESFVDPALRHLYQGGARVHFNHRLRAAETSGERITALDFGGRQIAIQPDDAVILAVPPTVAAELIPGLVTPTKFAAILNAHFRIDPPKGADPILGVIGGTAEWLVSKPGLVSVTISAADRLIDRDRAELAAAIWADVAKIHGFPLSPMPAWQIVKEKRATFRATREELARRPGAKTHLKNLALAGDWTATGLPATIEGAIRSGNAAAAMVTSADFG